MAAVNKGEVVSALREISQEGWGEGTTEKLVDMVSHALNFVGLLPDAVPSPAIVQGEDGGVCLEWCSPEGGVLRVEFFDDGSANYLASSSGEECEGGAEEAASLAQLIAEALGGQGA